MALSLQIRQAQRQAITPAMMTELSLLQLPIGELREAVRDHTNIDEELGDVLFTAVRVASTLERDPEQALHAACEKFIRRFTAMEQTALAEGRPLETLSKDELLAGWNAQKRVVPGGEQ